MPTTKVKMGTPVNEEKVQEETLQPGATIDTDDIQSYSAPPVETNEDPDTENEGIDIATLDPEQEVWPGGPTVGQTLGWKDQYGEIYTTSLTMDFHVMWRPINRLEYKQHVKQMEQISQTGKLSPVELNMFQEEALTELCVLFPQYSRADMSNELAGMPSIIAQQVMEASGFTALEVRQI